MSILPKTLDEIRLMERACRTAALALQHTGKFVRAGITTAELDAIADDFIRTCGAVSACTGYCGYPRSICTSVNEVICHGLPDERVLVDGDIINIDVTVIQNGFHGDTSAMFFVGEPSPRARSLVDCAFGAMHKGIAAATHGATTGDIGFAVDKFVTRSGFFAVREVGGHGIGREFHEEPFVPSHGKKGRGTKLKAGCTITVEPMVNETAARIRELPIPGSTITVIVTSDSRWSAQFEHTILITEGAPVILTAA
jgi:methionyl aminopeptidase